MSILTSTSYPIARPTGRCAATGQPIPIGDTCIAVLVERDDGQNMERLDFAVEAWESGARPQAPLKLVGSWRTVVTADDQKKNRFLDDEELLDLFEQMQDAAADPRRAAFRYVLALLLIRRRLLRHEGTRPADNGPPVLLVARRKGENNPMHEVVDPGMADEAIAAAVEQLTEIMAPDSSPAPARQERRP